MWKQVAEAFVKWIADGRIGRAVGTAAGVFLGFIYLIWGFWDMLVFALIVLAGYALGLKTDNREKWLDINAIARWWTGRHDR